MLPILITTGTTLLLVSFILILQKQILTIKTYPKKAYDLDLRIQVDLALDDVKDDLLLIKEKAEEYYSNDLLARLLFYELTLDYYIKELNAENAILQAKTEVDVINNIHIENRQN